MKTCLIIFAMTFLATTAFAQRDVLMQPSAGTATKLADWGGGKCVIASVLPRTVTNCKLKGNEISFDVNFEIKTYSSPAEPISIRLLISDYDRFVGFTKLENMKSGIYRLKTTLADEDAQHIRNHEHPFGLRFKAASDGCTDTNSVFACFDTIDISN